MKAAKNRVANAEPAKKDSEAFAVNNAVDPLI